MLEEETKQLKNLLYKAKASLSLAPDGELRISGSNGTVQYQQGRKYLSKKNAVLIKQLAQKRYDREIIKITEKQIKQIEEFNKTFDNQAVINCTSCWNPALRKIITPYTVSNEEFAKQWEEQNYISRDCDGIYITANNERVRSKSEVIIADRLLLAGIPYRYEERIKLESNGSYYYLYPDFTALNTRTRKKYIIEHFGMMDNPDYAAKAIHKINTYANNGYIQGINILYTFETSQQPLDTNTVNCLINNYLK